MSHSVLILLYILLLGPHTDRFELSKLTMMKSVIMLLVTMVASTSAFSVGGARTSSASFKMSAFSGMGRKGASVLEPPG